MKERDRPYYKIVDGHRIPGAFEEDVFKSGLSYKPLPTDTFISTFPKCGTHWVQKIVTTIMKTISLDGQPVLKPACHFLEKAGLSGIEALPHPRVISTHLPFSLVPYSKNAKYIYMARNPKDCCVSFYHHTLSIPQYLFSDGTFEEFFEIFVEGLTDFGNYYENLKSWHSRRNDDNVLFLTYESVKDDFRRGVFKIAEFLDPGYKRALEEDDEKFAELEKQCALSHMKTELLKERPDAGAFIRKGVVGDWKNYFSDEQSKRLEERFHGEMAGTDIPQLWESVDWLTKAKQ